jgi:23S rRNA pseudoU1915 N3-methylase RlmH
LNKKFLLKEKEITLKTVLIEIFETEPGKETIVPSNFSIEEWNYLEKQKKLGISNFLGELNKINLIESSFVVSFIEKLFSKDLKEETFEQICKILTVCGKEFEESNLEEFQKIFEKIEEFSKKFSKRIYFMTMDLKEQRSKWLPLILRHNNNNKQQETLRTDSSTKTNKKIVVIKKKDQTISSENITPKIESEEHFIEKIQQDFEEYFGNEEFDEFEYSLSKDFKKEELPKVFAEAIILFSKSTKKYEKIVQLLFEKYPKMIEKNFCFAFFNHLIDKYPLYYKDYPNIDSSFAFCLSQFFIHFPLLMNASFFSYPKFLSLRDLIPSKKQLLPSMGVCSVLFIKFGENLVEQKKQFLLKSSSKLFRLQDLLKSGTKQAELFSFTNQFKFIQNIY